MPISLELQHTSAYFSTIGVADYLLVLARREYPLKMSTSDHSILESHSAFMIGITLNKLCQDLSGYPDVGIRSPVNHKRTLQFLNQGHFHELLMCLADVGQYQLRYNKGKWMVLLGAYSMKLGAIIEKEDLIIIRSAL